MPALGVYLVELRFPREGYAPPTLARLPGAAGSLPAAAQALPWARGEGPAVAFDAGAHLVQRVDETPDGDVVARYLFDETYARAHPEALDPEHLALLHGTIAAKILDDGALVVDRDGLAASLRWRSERARGVRLTRAGGRERT